MRKKFFNMIPGADSCCILLYGHIGEYEKVNSADITREIYEAAAKYKKIDVRINSLGGDVFTGIAIFNALLNCDADITIYVDGVAASMASVIALCGKPCYMSKYARLMIHGVSGGAWGNREELLDVVNQIEMLEETLCAMCAKKIGKTAEEVRSMYFDGEDHWLTAQEALALGFIDGLYDAEPVPEDSTPEQIYDIYQNSLKNNTKQCYMIDRFKIKPGFAACTTEEDVLKHVDELVQKAAEAETLKAENERLKSERQATEAAEVESIVDKAHNDGRITENEKGVWRAALLSNRKENEALLQSLQPKRRVMSDVGSTDDGKPSCWDQRMADIRSNIKH